MWKDIEKYELNVSQLKQNWELIEQKVIFKYMIKS
jgi:hypothetical protein